VNDRKCLIPNSIFFDATLSGHNTFSPKFDECRSKKTDTIDGFNSFFEKKSEEIVH